MEELNIEKFNRLKMTYPRESIYYKALENLLQAYKQDEKVIEEMAECINNLGWSDLEENKEIIDYFRKKCE